MPRLRDERVTFLRMLGAQAMISIASARLHDSLERRVAERTAQLEDANRKLATLSITDGLTGLANRRHFDDVLRSECARAMRAGQPLSVIMLDVDYFKRYNDRYGHQAGDACLIRVAQALAGRHAPRQRPDGALRRRRVFDRAARHRRAGGAAYRRSAAQRHRDSSASSTPVRMRDR